MPVSQEINCKIVDSNENDDKSDENSNSAITNSDLTSWNFAQNPEVGDAIVDEMY